MALDEEARKKYEAQTRDLYAALGRFVVEFEHVCNYLRVIVMGVLSREGLANDDVMQILLSDQTAEPLRALAMSLIYETHELSAIDKSIVDCIMKRVQELTRKRNDVIHATWFIGWAGSNDNEFTDAPGVKFKKNKEGAALKRFDWKAKDFDGLADEAEELWHLVSRLNGCLNGNFRIENNFAFDSDGNLSSAKKMYE